MPTEKSRYTIIVDDNLPKQINDFRFENRFPSHSAAAPDLIHRDIGQPGKEQEISRKDNNRE